MTPDKPHKPYNTNSKNTVNRDPEPENCLFDFDNNVVDRFSHSDSAAQGLLISMASKI